MSWLSWLNTHRWRLATGLVAVAMLVPVALDHDDFPLSTYPMYSEARPSTVVLPTAVAVNADGEQQRLSLDVIAGVDDPLIAAAELRDAIAADRAGEACVAVARRLVASGDDRRGRSSIVVEVATERHDTVARVRGEPSEVAREVHARCTLEGST